MQLSQVLKSNTKTSSVRYDMKHKSDGRQDTDRTEPVTKEDWKIHKAHKVDSVYYNMNHAHDHLEELTHSYNDIKKEDPKEGERLKKLIIKTLGHCLRDVDFTVKEK